jgi:hypothetical protein
MNVEQIAAKVAEADWELFLWDHMKTGLAHVIGYPVHDLSDGFGSPQHGSGQSCAALEKPDEHVEYVAAADSAVHRDQGATPDPVLLL